MKFLWLTLLVVPLFLFSSEHGIYLKIAESKSGDIEKLTKQVRNRLTEAGFQILNSHRAATPDITRESESGKCGFNARLIVFTSPEYIDELVSYGNKYLVAGFLRIGLYQTENGLTVSMADPETINRIIFNDLPESEYIKISVKSAELKNSILQIIHAMDLGPNMNQPMPPLRTDEALREGAKDMFMMVGPMTFFRDTDQFPVIFETGNKNGTKGLVDLLDQINSNLSGFKPDEDDVDYRWSNSAENLKWKIISSVFTADSNAVLLGITRPRTEALSFRIAGESRESDSNKCPGLDHITAYPIEVLILNENDKITIYSPREMFRMDMYFWDAGKMAFMKYMQMPGMLDDSIKKALLNINN